MRHLGEAFQCLGVLMTTELILVCNTCLGSGRGVAKATKVIDCKKCKTPMKEVGHIWHKDAQGIADTGETENNF